MHAGHAGDAVRPRLIARGRSGETKAFKSKTQLQIHKLSAPVVMRGALGMPCESAALPQGTVVTWAYLLLNLVNLNIIHVFLQIKKRYGLPPGPMLRSLLRRELTLVQRNSVIYGFRFFQ